MGQLMSSNFFYNQNQLTDSLIRRKYIFTANVEKVFRYIDRGFYFPSEVKKDAYNDSAWQTGLCHLSAPSIYATALECLELQTASKFLNIGSGIGYLSTMAGFILGINGVNHGIELHQFLVDLANQKLEELKLRAAALDHDDFCEPVFLQGNIFELKSTGYYDRVYCGADVAIEGCDFMKSLIKIGGILVMPTGGYLLKIKREDEHVWKSERVLEVNFSNLVVPNVCNDNSIQFPSVEPPSLENLCRSKIRSLLRNNITEEFPLLKLNTWFDLESYSPPKGEFIGEDDSLSNFVSLQYGVSNEDVSSFRNIVDTFVGLNEAVSDTDSLSDEFPQVLDRDQSRHEYIDLNDDGSSNHSNTGSIHGNAGSTIHGNDGSIDHGNAGSIDHGNAGSINDGLVLHGDPNDDLIVNGNRIDTLLCQIGTEPNVLPIERCVYGSDPDDDENIQGYRSTITRLPGLTIFAEEPIQRITSEVEESVNESTQDAEESVKRKTQGAGCSIPHIIATETENSKRMRLNMRTENNDCEKNISNGGAASDSWETVSTVSSKNSWSSDYQRKLYSTHALELMASTSLIGGLEESRPLPPLFNSFSQPRTSGNLNNSTENNDANVDDPVSVNEGIDRTSKRMQRSDAIDRKRIKKRYDFEFDADHNRLSLILKTRINLLQIPAPIICYINYNRVDRDKKKKSRSN